MTVPPLPPALTNAFPVRRLLAPAAAVGGTSSAPAAYVRADLTVGRLEQTYRRITDAPDGPRFAYRAPLFDFGCELRYDPGRSGAGLSGDRRAGALSDRMWS